MTTAAPPRPRVLTHAAALAQLAAMGVFGVTAFTILISVLATGVGLLIIAVGIPFLSLFAYGLFGVAWIEYERVEGLYRLGLPQLQPRRRERPGFGGWLRMTWSQATDGATWRGALSSALATLLGLAAMSAIGTLMASVVIAFAPLSGVEEVRVVGGLAVPAAWATAVGISGALLSLAVCAGIVLLHAAATRDILTPSRAAALAAQARAATEQRAGAVRASEVERTRIERDLHDGVQPRLVSVAMTLGMAQEKLQTDPATAKDLIDEAHTSTKAAITDLRQLARGIHASVLDDRGLDAALSALAARSPVPVQLDTRIDTRCSRTAEAAVYFAVAESLTNAAKHSRGSQARVAVRCRPDQTLWARIEDDGIGGARILPGGGLDGITQRILAAGGTARLESPAGGPTALEVSVPCAS
ncbi:sensor histidine kinase [Microbacterium sp.]|uniref:sensor histidine kinase n=1 Tax=Microbacterium sp. TaxID=51671 RepID=UPI003A8A27E9